MYIVKFEDSFGGGFLKHAYSNKPFEFSTVGEAEYFVKLTTVSISPDQYKIVPVAKK